MAQESMRNPEVTPDKAIKAIQGQESEEGGLESKLPAAPFSLKAGKEDLQPPGQDKVSPMALQPTSIQGVQKGLPTANDLINQAQQISAQIQTAKQHLQTPNLQFKPSTAELLTQHLNHVQDNLSVISSRLNLPSKPAIAPKSDGKSIIEYFLSYLTGSDRQLKEVTEQLTRPPKSGAFAPAEMLAVQIKMNGVQQQMQFFTVLLGKAIDNIKTVMNIQN